MPEYSDEQHELARKAKEECRMCAHRRAVPGNAHIQCANPDPAMTGHEHGIYNGWFAYPLLFDPVWKTKLCANFTNKVKKSDDD